MNLYTNIEETAQMADTKFFMTVLGVVVVVSFGMYNASHVSFSFAFFCVNGQSACSRVSSELRLVEILYQCCFSWS